MLLPLNTSVWVYQQLIDFRKQIYGIVILMAIKPYGMTIGAGFLATTPKKHYKTRCNKR